MISSPVSKMSTAGDHVPTPGCSPRYSGDPKVSSNTRFIRFCNDDSSFIGSQNRTIAMALLLLPAADRPPRRARCLITRLLLRGILVLRIDDVALGSLPPPGSARPPGRPAFLRGGRLLVHVLREGVGLLDQLL